MGHLEQAEEPSRLVCPKCGYEQEERLDCLKCGIVFSKFIAFHAPDKTSRSDSAESGQAAPLVPEDSPAFDASEIRQQVRELSRRFSEVEFERVERSQLRSDLRALERRSLSELEQLKSRLTALETLVDEPPAPPPAPAVPDYAELVKDLKSTHVDPLVERLAELEHRVEEVVEVITRRFDMQIAAQVEILDARASVLETQLARLCEERDSKASAEATHAIQLSLQALKSEMDVHMAASDQGAIFGNQISELREQAKVMLERLQSLEGRLEHLSSVTNDTEQPRATLAEDVHYIREGLDHIRRCLAQLNSKN